MTFRILTVCTGNVCRSPLAEQLLRNELLDIDTVVSSAGIAALVGHPMDHRAAEYSLQLGGDPERHRARQLTVEELRATPLVLVASREHRRAVVEMLPRLTRSAFTIREFARLLQTINADDRAEVATQTGTDARLSALVDIAASNRGISELPANPADDDILDPFRQDDAVYAASVEQLVPAIRSISPILRSAMSGFA